MLKHAKSASNPLHMRRLRSAASFINSPDCPRTEALAAESVLPTARCADRDQLLPRAEEQRAIRYRRSRQAGFMQLIGTRERILVCRRQYKHNTLLAGEIDMPPIRYG